VCTRSACAHGHAQAGQPEFCKTAAGEGFTQERFAEASGVTQQYVSSLERGERNPTVVTLYHLATALGVSPVELVTPDDEAPREARKRRSENHEGRRPRRQELASDERPADGRGAAVTPAQSRLRRDQTRA
jgi:transcriptional regulator with XRE-family HTH domain